MHVLYAIVIITIILKSYYIFIVYVTFPGLIIARVCVGYIPEETHRVMHAEVCIIIISTEIMINI